MTRGYSLIGTYLTAAVIALALGLMWLGMAMVLVSANRERRRRPKARDIMRPIERRKR